MSRKRRTVAQRAVRPGGVVMHTPGLDQHIRDQFNSRARVAGRVAFGEVNGRLRVWRPTSSHLQPGERAARIARLIASIGKGLRMRPHRVGWSENAVANDSGADLPSRAALPLLCSRFLSLTADRRVNGSVARPTKPASPSILGAGSPTFGRDRVFGQYAVATSGSAAGFATLVRRSASPAVGKRNVVRLT